ncbi:ATP-binding protein [Paludibacterium yongneupense]|uniref:ATP-binding protein n=1 Tax=Paludibacterium yongneupense TaxID=400061 RepID=UPI00040BFD3D|nr:ATP-binding protein [Paludibacterium yongneupense]
MTDSAPSAIFTLLSLAAALIAIAAIPSLAGLWRRKWRRRRLAVLAHELRTPLDALGGLLELQCRQQANRQQDAELSRQAVICVRELSSLLDSLLSWAEGKRRPTALRPTRLERLVDSVGQLFALQAAQRSLYLEIGNGDIVDAPLLLDATRLRQILVNLLSNAIRHSNGGAVRLSASSVATGPDRVAVEIRVEDNGSGLGQKTGKAGTLPHERLPESHGLGLGICRELCAAMRASLDVDSDPEKGTCFSLRFNCSRAGVEPADEEAESGTGFDAASVLVVDDNPSTRILLERQLTLLALDVTSCPDGSTALRQWRRQPFDLILCDRYMPTMDGIQFVRRIRRMERRYRLGRTPIVGLSAGDGSEFADADIDASSLRPATLTVLQRLIRPFLREAEATTRLQLSALKQLTDDDPSFETEFLESIRQCNRHDIARALHGYRNHDLADLANPVHRLTGMARLICHPALATRGSEVEKAIRREDSNRVAQLLPLWLDDMQALEREIERRLAWLARRNGQMTAPAPDQTSRS